MKIRSSHQQPRIFDPLAAVDSSAHDESITTV
jgi:hypothetical protein